MGFGSLVRRNLRRRPRRIGADPLRFPLPEAVFLNGRMLEPGSAEMAVGRVAAQAVGLALGDRVELLRRHVLVVSGIFSSGRGLTDYSAVVDIGKAQEISGMGSNVNLALLRVPDPGRVGHVVRQVEATLPHLTAFRPDSWEILERQQVALVGRFSRAIASVAFLLAALGMANTMSMSVLERLLEIGILRAVGWRRRQIVGLVLAEVSLMTGLGAALSLPLGNTVLALMIDSLPLWVAEIRVAPSIFTEGIVPAVTASLGGTCPAVLAVLRTNPVDLFRAS